MALVEIQSGPFRLTAAVTCDDVEGLGLNAGIPVTAIVSPTSVMISRDLTDPVGARPPKALRLS